MTAVAILITVFSLASVVVMLWVFVWAARKDGEEDLNQNGRQSDHRGPGDS